MGKVDIPYYVTRGENGPGTRKMGYWAPCLARRSTITGKIEPTLMAILGFQLVDCGADGPVAWARAEMWNKRWKEARRRHLHGEPQSRLERQYPPGSIGEGFAKFRETNAWGVDKKPRTREGWERGWKHIDPVFGDVDANTVGLHDVDLWYGGDPEDPKIQGLVQRIGIGEAYQAMKIWRALWGVLGTIKRDDGEPYCKGKDPSLGIRAKQPKRRTAFWLHHETEILIRFAGSMRYLGLQAALAVAWDTQLSPVDVRNLTPNQLRQDAIGSLFDLERAKTGRAAIGTLTEPTRAMVQAYIESLPFTLMPDMPIFHTRGSAPGPNGGRPRAPVRYTKDTLGDDFRDVRKVAFPGDKRTIADFRRSGAVESTAGQVDPAALAAKMANSIDTNRELQKVYQPHTAALVRIADEARLRGRPLLHDAAVKKNGSGK